MMEIVPGQGYGDVQKNGAAEMQHKEKKTKKRTSQDIVLVIFL